MSDIAASLRVHGKDMREEGEQLIADMDDDTLAEMWDAWCKQAEHLGKLARGAHQELEARMRHADPPATHLETEHWSGRMKPGVKEHTVDDPQRLRKRLGPVTSNEDRLKVFIYPSTPPMRVDRRGLNELYKLGGEVARIIDEERQTVQGDARLVLTKKEVKG